MVLRTYARNASRKARGHVVESHEGLINRWRGSGDFEIWPLEPTPSRAFHPTPRPTYEIQTRAPPPPVPGIIFIHHSLPSRYNVMYITYYVICINLR